MRRAKNIYFALSHEVRRNIIRLSLERGTPLSPLETALLLDKPLSSVSYHFRTLAECGVIRLIRTEPRRGSLAHFYVTKKSVAAEQWIRKAVGVNAA